MVIRVVTIVSASSSNINAIVRPPWQAGRGAANRSLYVVHKWGLGMFRVEGVTEASLTSDVFVACLSPHSCRGLAGLSPSASSEGVRKLSEPASRRVGNCMLSSAIRRSPILNFS